MVYIFADCELNQQQYVLSRAGDQIKLRPKVFQVLVYLLEHRDRVVSKQELCQEVWAAQFVSDATLENCIKAARRAVGDSGREQRVIQTLYGHGYRFIAEVDVRPTFREAAGQLSSATRSIRGRSNSELWATGLDPVAVQQFLHGGELLSCPGCQHTNLPQAIFCAVCGVRLTQTCVHCGHVVLEPAAFCTTCGQALPEWTLALAEPASDSHDPHPNDPSLTPPPAYAGERKPVTILHCALAHDGSRDACGELDTLHAQMQQLYEVARREVGRYGGLLQPVMGSRILAVFGAPVAQKDHARHAVLAALGLQQQLKQPYRHLLDERVVARVGLHTGLVAVGGLGDETAAASALVGDTSVIARVLQERAEPGQILCSEATARNLHQSVELTAGGQLEVSGQTEPIQVYQVVGLAQPPVLRLFALGHFVGREEELVALRTRQQQVETGPGQVLGIVGEPGIGKSRLLEEFRRTMREKRLTYLSGRCVSYGRMTPYLPVMDLLRQACGILDGDGPEAIRSKLEWTLQGLEISDAEWRAHLLSLLGVSSSLDHHVHQSPQAIKVHTFAALLQLVMSCGQGDPLVIEVEDLHWIDATSEEWLEALVSQLGNAPILVVVTYHPGYSPPWLDQPHNTQLALSRLTQQDSRQIVDEVLSGLDTPESFVEEMIVKANGNPFFLEELARTVSESGVRNVSSAVPNSIQAVLAARIDRLPSSAKRLVQIAAVIGKDIAYSLLEAVSGFPEEGLRQALEHLQTAELLYATQSVPEATYTFKHILIQEAAYQSLLHRTLQNYHASIAKMIAERFPEIETTQPELLAYHYTAAGNREKAIAYWQRAGQHALERSASVEAISHLAKGLEVLSTMPDTPERAQQEATLQITLGNTLTMMNGFAAPEVVDTFARARELCRTLDDTLQLFRLLQTLFPYYLVRGELQTAHELGERCLAMSQRQQDRVPLMWSHILFGTSLYYMGDVSEALDHLEQGLALYDPDQHHERAYFLVTNPAVVGLSYMSLVLWSLGYPEQALLRSEEAVAFAQELEHPFSLALSLNFATALRQFRREAAETRAYAETLIGLSKENRFPNWEAHGMILRGWACAHQGEVEAGMVQIQQGLTLYRAIGSNVGWPNRLILLAEVCGKNGQTIEGLRVLDEALAAAQDSGQQLSAAVLYWLQGTLRVQIGHVDEAEASFDQALTISRRQQAKIWELRATVGLSRLWLQQGRHTDVRNMLEAICGWFSEGQLTMEFQEAKALLGELP